MEKLWRASTSFMIVDAFQNGARVAKRGFYFWPSRGGDAKQF